MISRVGLHIRSSHILTDGIPVVKVNQSAWRRSPIPSAKTVSFDSASRPFREEITAPFDAKAERQGRTLCPLSRLVFHLLRPSVRLRHHFFFSFSFFSCVFPLRPSSYASVSLRYSSFALRPLLSSFSFAFILTFRPPPSRLPPSSSRSRSPLFSSIFVIRTNQGRFFKRSLFLRV